MIRRIALVATIALAACSGKDRPATTTTPAKGTPAAAAVDAAPAIADTPPPAPDAEPAPEGPTECDQIVARVAELGHEMTDCEDGRFTADDVACYAGAKTFAATWSCFAAVAGRNVTDDAKTLNGQIVDAAISYARDHKEFPIGKTGSVPKRACCKAKDHLCHDAASTWTK